jgi:hypothetical protein
VIFVSGANCGQNDGRFDVVHPRRERDALSVISGGSADHAALFFVVAKAMNLVIRAAILNEPLFLLTFGF